MKKKLLYLSMLLVVAMFAAGCETEEDNGNPSDNTEENNGNSDNNGSEDDNTGKLLPSLVKITYKEDGSSEEESASIAFSYDDENRPTLTTMYTFEGTRFHKDITYDSSKRPLKVVEEGKHSDGESYSNVINFEYSTSNNTVKATTLGEITEVNTFYLNSEGQITKIENDFYNENYTYYPDGNLKLLIENNRYSAREISFQKYDDKKTIFSSINIPVWLLHSFWGNPFLGLFGGTTGNNVEEIKIFKEQSEYEDEETGLIFVEFEYNDSNYPIKCTSSTAKKSGGNTYNYIEVYEIEYVKAK